MLPPDNHVHTQWSWDADAGAMEVNKVVPLRPEIVRWWHEAGGEAVSFGSDAHAPAAVARDFAASAAMVEAQGFVPGRDRGSHERVASKTAWLLRAVGLGALAGVVADLRADPAVGGPGGDVQGQGAGRHLPGRRPLQRRDRHGADPDR